MPQLSFDFHRNLSAEYVIRELPRIHDHPAHDVRAPEQTEDTMEVAEDLARDWATINLAEEIAFDDIDMELFLRDIH